MEELKYLSDKELANRMVSYIQEIETLLKNYEVQHELDCYSDILIGKYAYLKKKICEEAHYFDLVRNKGLNDTIIKRVYILSIKEAAGKFKPLNGRFDQQKYNSLVLAKYDLTGRKDLQEWKEIGTIELL